MTPRVTDEDLAKTARDSANVLPGGAAEEIADRLEALAARIRELEAALRRLVDRHDEGWLMDQGGGGAEGWQSDGLKADLDAARSLLDAMGEGAMDYLAECDNAAEAAAALRALADRTQTAEREVQALRTAGVSLLNRAEAAEERAARLQARWDATAGADAKTLAEHQEMIQQYGRKLAAAEAQRDRLANAVNRLLRRWESEVGNTDAIAIVDDCGLRVGANGALSATDGGVTP